MKGLLGIVTAAVAVGHGLACRYTVHLAVDTSGSINDQDEICLAKLRETEGPSYSNSKPCWQLINNFARETINVVQAACRVESPPKVSIVLFRCPDTGKDRKILLEPSNNQIEITSALEKLYKHKLDGFSCGLGALSQVNTWIEQENNQTTPIPTHIVVLLSDGKLQPKDLINSQKQTNKIKQVKDEEGNSKSMILAAAPFPTNPMKQKLNMHTEEDLIFDASDPSGLELLGLSSFATLAGGDLKMCSEAQIACVDAHRKLLETGERTCDALSDLYTGLTACLKTGCKGLDITVEKDACLAAAKGSCPVDCTHIATHINAQSYEFSGDQDVGYETSSTWPGAIFNNRQFVDTMLGELSGGWEIEDPSGGPSSPIVGNSGNILIGSSAPVGASHVYNLHPITGFVVWKVASLFGGKFLAQPVVGGKGGMFVFIGDSDGIFYQIHETTGKIIKTWNLGSGAIRAAAVVPGNSKYVLVAADGEPGISKPQLHRISLDTWDNQHKPELKPNAWKRMVCMNEDGTSNDFVLNGMHVTSDQGIIVTCRQGTVSKYSVLNGDLLWSVRNEGETVGMPSFTPGALYMAVNTNTGSRILKYSTSNGELIWELVKKKKVNVAPVLTPGNDRMIAFMENGKLLRLNADDGSSLLNRTLLPAPFMVTCTPAVDVARNAVLFCVNSKVILIDIESLQVLVDKEMGAQVVNSPIIYENSMYISTKVHMVRKVGKSLGGTSIDDEGPVTLKRGKTEDVDGAEESNAWPSSAIATSAVLGGLILYLGIVHITLSCKKNSAN